MKVSELIELLKQMPQDARVELGLDSEGQTGDGIVVSLEQSSNDQYVFIGDY